ncbi:MAG: tetratricopeptide repeat protein [Myxococcota bacterium]
MNKRILSACVTAIALAGCNDTKPEAKQPTPIVQAMPVDPVVEVASAPSVIDAGTTLTIEPEIIEDLLGLAHEHRGSVDHLGRAKELRTLGDLEGALTEARRAVYDLPSDEETLSTIARLARLAGKKDLAAEAFGRLALVRPDDAVPLIQQARMLIAQGDVEGALKVGVEAVLRDPENPEGHQVVGRAQLSAGDLSPAITSFEKVVSIDPEHGWALNNLGFAYLRANENPKAVEVLTKAAELLPHVAYVHNNLGVALERVGRVEDAKLAYAKSTSLSPKYVKAQLNAARVAKAVIPGSVEEKGTDVGLEEEIDLPEVELSGE